MILVFGGTTEGRAAVETLDEAGQTYYYSTRETDSKWSVYTAFGWRELWK